MFFNEAFRQQPVTHRAGERDVHDPASVHVSDFCIAESEFSAAEAVRVDRHVGPCGNFVFEPFPGVQFCFDDRTPPLDAREAAVPGSELLCFLLRFQIALTGRRLYAQNEHVQNDHGVRRHNADRGHRHFEFPATSGIRLWLGACFPKGLTRCIHFHTPLTRLA